MQTALIVGAGVVGGLIGLAAGGVGGGLVGLGAGLVLGGVAMLWLSAKRSEAAFFERYTEEREMSNEDGRLRLPPATPLLREGDERHAARAMEGPLGNGFAGLLALFTYEEHSSDSSGTGYAVGHDFTVALTEVPESVPLVPELYCRRRSGPRILDWLERSENPMQPVELESAVLAERCEILVSEMQDPNFMRELFSPSFIVWLTEEAPADLSFELFGGRLCCYLPGHRRTAAELDELRAAAAAIAARIREESHE